MISFKQTCYIFWTVVFCNISKNLGSCVLDLHLAFDTSNSMNTDNDKCLSHINRMENFAIDERVKHKPCWFLNVIFAKEAYYLTKKVCNIFGQKDPALSIALFRCKKSGKYVKVMLEPNNDQTLIEEKFDKLFNQIVNGESTCSRGTFEKILDWTKERTDKTPVMGIFSDGKLSDPESAGEILTELRETNEKHLLFAAPTYLTGNKKNLLSNYVYEDFILKTSDLLTLEKLKFPINGVIYQPNDPVFQSCTAEQKLCFNIRQAANNMTTNGNKDICKSIYTGIASCARHGCIGGLDMAFLKQECLSTCNDSKNCDDISSHVNALSNYQASRGENAFEHLNSSLAELENLGDFYRSIPMNGRFSSVNNMILERGSSFIVEAPKFQNLENGFLITGKHGGLFRIQNDMSKTIWQKLLNVKFIAEPVVSTDGAYIFIGDDKGFFYQLHADSGETKRIWNFGPEAITVRPIILKNESTVFIAIDGIPGLLPSYIYKVNFDVEGNPNDAIVWKRPICEISSTSDAIVKNFLQLNDNGFVFTCRSGKIQRLDIKSASIIYTHELRSGESYQHPMPIANENSFVTCDTDGYVYKFALSGEKLFDTTNRRKSSCQKVIATSKKVFVLNFEKEIVSFFSNGTFAMKKKLDNSMNHQGVLAFEIIDDSSFTSNNDDKNGKAIIITLLGKILLLNLDTLEIESENLFINGTQKGEILTSVKFIPSINNLIISTTKRALGMLSIFELLPKKINPEAVVGNRRILWHTKNKTWPISAIVLTIVLSLLLLILPYFISKQLRNNK